MELREVFKSIWLIAGGLFGILIICALIKSFIDELIIKPRKEKKAREKIMDSIDQITKEVIKSANEKTEKPKRGRPRKESKK